MSQQHLADILGVTKAAVSHWESQGDAGPTIDNLAKTASALGVAFEWLATGRGRHDFVADSRGMLNDKSAGGSILSPPETELLALFRRLSADKRQALLTLLKK